ncbi:hypothetical protein PAXRUDRAFT_140419 [Paxillus rubicundulus Ve08.2h10]|uniref:Unplaced genomic scaffold scaffold_212, whole genome shotgun sequence n=1 Tax=Paxillus rubicundulus Ve08.2h10 TaxID=930991 RepID=A0A0D0DRF5_9AGAM|nr:hypothetical protein PAXRUDRAFT_140419 [Paxillus rubicundulus Ve08.2h10]
MKHERWHICLLIDNFSGHKILYELLNIDLELNEPNMTALVQPCDVGIIHCIKAHYCRSFCQCTVDMDKLCGN